MSDAAQRYRSRTLRILNQKRDSAPNKVPIPPQLDFIHQQKTPWLTCALFFEAISAFMQFARWVGRHAPRPVNLWKKIKPATTHEKDGRDDRSRSYAATLQERIRQYLAPSSYVEGGLSFDGWKLDRQGLPGSLGLIDRTYKIAHFRSAFLENHVIALVKPPRIGCAWSVTTPGTSAAASVPGWGAVSLHAKRSVF
jgi:hypothetical protein